MLKVISAEGPRGAGKSAVTRLMRDHIEGATLINPTGFKDDGKDGLLKIRDYYEALEKYLVALKNSGHDYTVIFDRTFFSEMIYSELYKSYDFSGAYSYLLDGIYRYADEFHLFFLKVTDQEVLKERLTRDKIQLFGAVEESIAQSTRQQQSYEKLFEGFEKHIKKGRGSFSVIDTSYLTSAEVEKQMMEVLSSCQK